jgi:uncharacterized damage-inducible protein DinB
MPVPERSEFAPYYFTYIDRIPDEDILGRLEVQQRETLAFLRQIPEDKSRYRYAPDKWSIRQVLSHINDAERVFQFRAFWFARGLEMALPSMDQDACAATAKADEYSWTAHIEDFAAVRSASLTLFRNLPREAWTRSGIASEKRFTVNALAYILAGHVAHHRAMLEERYL